METGTLIARCRELRATGSNREDILRALRNGGASKVDSIGVIVELERLSLADAKQIVDSSPVWHDLKARDDQLRRDLSTALHDLHEDADKIPGMKITPEKEEP